MSGGRLALPVQRPGARGPVPRTAPGARWAKCAPRAAPPIRATSSRACSARPAHPPLCTRNARWNGGRAGKDCGRCGPRTPGPKPRDIALFAHGQAPLKERAEAVCARAGVPCRELRHESPVSEAAISIGTVHRARVLEFKAVIVGGCEERLLPMRALLDRLSDPADRDAFIEQEKHLLYVACTRAREGLVVTHSGPTSRFLP